MTTDEAVDALNNEVDDRMYLLRKALQTCSIDLLGNTAYVNQALDRVGFCSSRSDREAFIRTLVKLGFSAMLAQPGNTIRKDAMRVLVRELLGKK